MTVKRSAVILNTDAHRPARDQFVHHLNEATRREGWRNYEAMSHWLGASFRAMRSATLQFSPEDLEKNEAEYMQIVKRCRHPQETMRDLSLMLAAVVVALEAAPIDFIGPIFGELASSDQMGQFFTPYHISKMMADMIIGDPMQMLKESGRGFITLQEPACGVGGMTLAACEVLRERGFDLARQVHWSMIDIDYPAQCAAYIQTNLCGISADVFLGNSLALKAWMATSTLAAIIYPKQIKYDPKVVLPPPDPERPPAGPGTPPRSKPIQLSLFEGA